ncbi:MAG TPA: hypothetical protein VH062_13340 [Polyangiaceae bacterium]|jgi:hypothetical protein|nr:hypothetical protein [Polyangiaceae bacterium]
MASRSAALTIAFFALMSIPARAFACGASSGGVAGVSACSLSEHEEETRSKWRVGASYSFTSTAIRFDGNTKPEEQRDGVAISVAYRPSLRWTLEAGAGPLFGGHLRFAQATYDFRPGLLTTLGASYRILDALDARPFVLFTGQAAFVAASTRDPLSSQSTAYDALDIRLGAVAGWTIWNVFSPYGLVRAFGGPVYWTYQGRSVTGTDTHHYQVGLGGSVLIARRIDVFVEGVPLGEQAISAGAGVSF